MSNNKSLSARPTDVILEYLLRRFLRAYSVEREPKSTVPVRSASRHSRVLEILFNSNRFGHFGIGNRIF